MRPHFKRFFRSMAQKDLLLSDACLPFCGHSLPFLCRRFFSQTEKKCRNAGSVKSLIIVGREGSKPIISKSKLLYRLPPIADSRKGCPYERLAIDICRCRGSGASRSPHPTSCISKNLCRFRGRIISYYYFECQRNNPSVSASPSQLPYRGAK